MVENETKETTDANDNETEDYAIEYLLRLANGTEPSSYMVRLAASDVLVGLGVDWNVLRLLWIASRKGDRKKCGIARLNSDIIREICRKWFFLGGSM